VRGDVKSQSHEPSSSEVQMSTRKSKPTFPSEIELPSKQLQLITVSTQESRAPAHSRVRSPYEFSLKDHLAMSKRRLH
jgi:hypothetical protein